MSRQPVSLSLNQLSNFPDMIFLWIFHILSFHFIFNLQPNAISYSTRTHLFSNLLDPLLKLQYRKPDPRAFSMRHALCAWRGSEPQPLSVETTVLPVTPQPHNFVKKENKSDPFFPRPLPPTPIPLTLKLRRRIRLGKMLTQK